MLVREGTTNWPNSPFASTPSPDISPQANHPLAFPPFPPLPPPPISLTPHMGVLFLRVPPCVCALKDNQQESPGGSCFFCLGEVHARTKKHHQMVSTTPKPLLAGFGKRDLYNSTISSWPCGLVVVFFREQKHLAGGGGA